MGIFNHYLIAVFTATAQEGELLGNYLCCGAGLVVLIYPLTVAHGADDRDGATTLQMLVKKFGKFAVSLHAVPFGPCLALALLIAVVLVGGQRELCGSLTGLEDNGLRVGAEVTGKVDVVTYVHYSERL